MAPDLFAPAQPPLPGIPAQLKAGRVRVGGYTFGLLRGEDDRYQVFPDPNDSDFVPCWDQRMRSSHGARLAGMLQGRYIENPTRDQVAKVIEACSW